MEPFEGYGCPSAYRSLLDVKAPMIQNLAALGGRNSSHEGWTIRTEMPGRGMAPKPRGWAK